MDRGQLACRTTLGVETVSSSQPDRSKDPFAGSITDADREGSTKRAIMNVTVRRFEGGEWSVFTIECVDLSEDRVAHSKAQALTDQRAPIAAIALTFLRELVASRRRRDRASTPLSAIVGNG
jgi:hypothetical protein